MQMSTTPESKHTRRKRTCIHKEVGRHNMFHHKVCNTLRRIYNTFDPRKYRYDKTREACLPYIRNNGGRGRKSGTDSYEKSDVFHKAEHEDHPDDLHGPAYDYPVQDPAYCLKDLTGHVHPDAELAGSAGVAE